MKIKTIAVCFALGLCGLATFAATPEKADGKTKKDVIKASEAIIKAVKPSLVIVQYYLKYDKGQEPVVGGYRCGECNRFHGTDAGSFVKEERPLEVPGYLVAPDRVISADPLIASRFLETIKVKFGDAEVKAGIATYFTEQQSLELKLESPLKSATPLALDPEVKAPFFNVTYAFDQGFWQVSVTPFERGKVVYLADIDLTVCVVQPNSLIVAENGKLAALSMNGTLPTDNSWRNPPTKLPQMSAEAMKVALDKLDKDINQGIFRVKLHFRSPKLDKTIMPEYGQEEKEQIETEYNTIGILFDTNKFLVLADLKPRVTARLESIQTFVPGNAEPLPAVFNCSLKDYGVLIAEFKTPAALKKITLSPKNNLKDVGNLLLKVKYDLAGDQLVKYFEHSWIADFGVGWRGMLMPMIPGDDKGAFLFNQKNELVALPMIRRAKATMEKSFSSPGPQLIQSCYMQKVLADLKNNIDIGNVPVPEAEEGRLAWLGIEAQPLNNELAKANNVSELTQNGQEGILITCVYPDSPAAKAGLKPGDILLRMFVEGDSAPINLKMDDPSMRRPFPWAYLDQIPEQYYERIPTPWQSAENNINNLLTNLGFGKKISIKCFIDGKVVSKDFIVEKAPEHYEIAEKYKNDNLGLTVRNITYEARRYFQMKDDAPGVIVAKIKPGSKASVSGIKPFEIITQVNDVPVNNVSDFKKQIKDQPELRLNVKRMSESRIVKMSAQLEPNNKNFGPRNDDTAANVND